MNTLKGLEADVVVAAELLRSTERGRGVLIHLREMMHGDLGGLDGRGWDAVAVLLDRFHYGFAGTVLDELDKRQ